MFRPHGAGEIGPNPFVPTRKSSWFGLRVGCGSALAKVFFATVRLQPASGFLGGRPGPWERRYPAG